MEIDFVTRSDLKNFEAKLDRILEDLKAIKDQPGIGQKSKWLDKEDLIKITHLSPRTLQNWRDHGWIPFSKVSGKIFYRAEDLDRLLNSNLTGGWQLEKLRK